MNTLTQTDISAINYYWSILQAIPNRVKLGLAAKLTTSVFEDSEETRPGDTPEQIKESLTEGFKGLKLLKEGKIQARPIEELFNELQD